jgi:hypothetical protein
VRISRRTGAMSGFLLVVLGLWGGLIPLIGPYFGFAFGSHATWDVTWNRFWLDLLPGAAVLLGGLMLIVSGHRMSGTVASWLALAGGAWFAVGPAVSRLWEHGPGPIGVPLYGHTRQTVELIGYFYGLGAVVVGLAAFALGRVVTRPALVMEPVPAAEEPVAQPVMSRSEPVTTRSAPVTAEPVSAGSDSAGSGSAEAGSAEPVARRRPITGDSTAPATDREQLHTG